jgi:hypothetical protein
MLLSINFAGFHFQSHLEQNKFKLTFKYIILVLATTPKIKLKLFVNAVVCKNVSLYDKWSSLVPKNIIHYLKKCLQFDWRANIKFKWSTSLGGLGRKRKTMFTQVCLLPTGPLRVQIPGPPRLQ